MYLSMNDYLTTGDKDTDKLRIKRMNTSPKNTRKGNN